MDSLKYSIESFRDLTTLGIICGTGPEEAFRKRLAKLAEIGFEYVYFGYDMFCHFREGGEPAVLRRAVADAGLKTHSAHFGYLYPGPGDTLEALKRMHCRDLDTAAEIGLRCVTTHYLSITGLGTEGFLTPATLAAYRYNPITGSEAVFEEAMKKLGGRDSFVEKNNGLYRWFCDEAAQRGITVTLETAAGHLARTPEQLIGHIRDIGRPNLGICLDSGHSHIMGVDVAEAVRACGSYLVETHFHDNVGDLDLHRPVGIGTINWPEVILALREIGFPGPVTFEAEGAPHNGDEEELRIYARNWREFLHTAALREARQNRRPFVKS